MIEASGVMAVVCMGGVLAATFWPVLADPDLLRGTWHTLEWAYNTVLFHLTGLVIGSKFIEAVEFAAFSFIIRYAKEDMVKIPREELILREAPDAENGRFLHGLASIFKATILEKSSPKPSAKTSRKYSSPPRGCWFSCIHFSRFLHCFF